MNPKIKIMLGTVGDAFFQVAPGAWIVTRTNSRAGQIGIRPRGMILEPLHKALLQGQLQAPLQRFPSLSVLVSQLDGPYIIQGMDENIDISPLLGQCDSSLPPVDSLSAFICEHGEPLNWGLHGQQSLIKPPFSAVSYNVLSGYAVLCHRDDDMALFVSGFDIPVGFCHLF
jgi:hypothetical protein